MKNKKIHLIFMTLVLVMLPMQTQSMNSIAEIFKKHPRKATTVTIIGSSILGYFIYRFCKERYQHHIVNSLVGEFLPKGKVDLKQFRSVLENKFKTLKKGAKIKFLMHPQTRFAVLSAAAESKGIQLRGGTQYPKSTNPLVKAFFTGHKGDLEAVDLILELAANNLPQKRLAAFIMNNILIVQGARHNKRFGTINKIFKIAKKKFSKDQIALFITNHNVIYSVFSAIYSPNFEIGDKAIKMAGENCSKAQLIEFFSDRHDVAVFVKSAKNKDRHKIADNAIRVAKNNLSETQFAKFSDEVGITTIDRF